MEWANKGTAALASSDANQAVLCFTRALIEHPHSPDYFTKRATSFTRVKPPRNDLAVRDAEIAVLLGQKRAKREKIQAAQQRRVIALYGLGKYEDAKQILESMKKWRKTGDSGKSDQMEHDMWMAKITGKLKDKAKATTDIKEYPDIDLPNEEQMKVWLESQVKNNAFDFENATTEIKRTGATTGPAQQEEQEDLTGAKEDLQRQAVKPPLTVLRQDFFQNNDNLIVTFYAKKVNPATFTCSIQSNAVQVVFPRPEDPATAFTFVADPLFSTVDPASSTYKIFGTKVELTLAKVEKGVKWPSLDAKDRPSTQTLPNPYVTKDSTDWDKKAAEITKKKPAKPKDDEEGEESDADSEYGGDKVDGFFKKLYAGADDDTRRAMMKSFMESNGTALSTNWADVSKGRVDEVKSKNDS